MASLVVCGPAASSVELELQRTPVLHWQGIRMWAAGEEIVAAESCIADHAATFQAVRLKVDEKESWGNKIAVDALWPQACPTLSSSYGTGVPLFS